MRRRTFLTGLALLPLPPVLTACGLGGPAYTEAVPADVDAVVEMTSAHTFSPASVTIPAGGSVEWRNTSIMTHTVTADPELAKDPADVQLPEGVEPFDSGDVPPGQVWRQSFNVPGTYRYFCKPHESSGMVGTVVVLSGG